MLSNINTVQITQYIYIFKSQKDLETEIEKQQSQLKNLTEQQQKLMNPVYLAVEETHIRTSNNMLIDNYDEAHQNIQNLTRLCSMITENINDLTKVHHEFKSLSRDKIIQMTHQSTIASINGIENLYNITKYNIAYANEKLSLEERINFSNTKRKYKSQFDENKVYKRIVVLNDFFSQYPNKFTQRKAYFANYYKTFNQPIQFPVTLYNIPIHNDKQT